MTGLTVTQVQQRLKDGRSNAVTAKAGLTEGQIVLRHTITFFNLVFVVLAVILALCGSGLHNMTFLMVAFFNTVIGCVQQIRAKRAVDRLSLVAVQTLPALRNGEKVPVRQDLLVQDDVVEFAAGDQICADGEVLEGFLQANESLITGEADPVDKHPGDTLQSGSFVLSGRALVRLTRVGNDAFAARLSLEAKKNPRAAKSEMMKTLDKMIRVLGFALIPVGLVLFYHEFQILQLGLQKSAEATVAAVVGMIPEGLYLLTSVALAVSAIKLTRQKVLVQDMGCIEALARADVLCVDKTGTITEPTMAVNRVIPLNGCTEAEAADILAALFGVQAPENDTGRALQAHFSKDTDWTCTEFIPFSPNTKWCAGVFEGHGTYITGAPERLLTENNPLTETVNTWQTEGFRVLLAGAYSGNPHKFDKAQVTPLALILLGSPIRPSAAKTFSYFARQGVQIKVISGDSAATASAVARQAGIAGAEHYLDATDLKTEEDFLQAAERYTVFGRVNPEQKKQLVQALQAKKHTVAMTGDGVNDVLAMRQADCAVAMASGTQAARQVSHLVLLESDFSAMPDIVAEGRRVINNIQRAASLFLVKNILSFGLALLMLAIGLPYPFAPIHLTIISVLTIGTPSFFLALEPNYSLVHGRFLPSILHQALPGGLTNVLVVFIAQILTAAFALPMTDMHTVCTAILAVVGMLVLYRLCRPFNWFRKVLWLAMGVGLVGCFLVLGPWFDLYITTPVSYLVLAVMMTAAIGMFVVIQALFRWTDKLRKR